MKKTSFPRLLPQGNVLPFLLLLVGALSHAKDVDASETKNCTEADTVLTEGDVRITANISKDDEKTLLYQVVYMQPEEGFEGIGVQVVTGNEFGQEKVAAWFSKDSLFAADNTARWWELYVPVQRFKNYIKFTVVLGDSKKVCVTWVTSDNLRSLEVVGYGPSRWKAAAPRPGCLCVGNNQSLPSPKSEPNCSEPRLILGATTSPPPTSMSTAVEPAWSADLAAVVGAVAGVLAVVVVVVVCWRKRRRSTDENAAPAAPSDQRETTINDNSRYQPSEACRDGASAGVSTERIQVIENSLYEPFEPYRNKAAAGIPKEGIQVIENSLYEPFEPYRNKAAAGIPKEGIHVIENSLYEPFEACRDGAAAGIPKEGIHVIENSLYEPFEACRDGAAAGTPKEGIHVIENSLYEPFEACRDGAAAGTRR
ncbi:uncharacterized protein LOC126991490 [Eriocheir sinensis]|uniref:uncharacterized protein LOC126991490 n=1 Tax=Eriocheir sinensis TaxID=95602 RepID=UPI0021C6596F|nr:uncharacterized protein LOC126991490 [Eriocheir sinensis]